MKKDLYFKTFHGYKNFVREFVFMLILALAHYPALMVDVFFRSKMGERYYTLAAALTWFIILLIPFYLRDEVFQYVDFLDGFNWFWLIFVLAFFAFAVIRRLEIKRTGGTFDTEKFSYTKGLRPVYQMLVAKLLDNHIFKSILFSRYVEKYFEALATMLVGLFFLIFPFSRTTGIVIAASGLLHMLKTHVQYAKGRHFVLDQLDRVILNEEFAESFVEKKKPEDTRFFDTSHLPRSNDKNTNKRISDEVKKNQNREDNA